MALKEYKPEKLLYTMGEVTEMFDVKPSLIRFWTDRFDIIKPQKNRKGNRLFTPDDVKNLEIIYHLTKERGMKLSGVEKYLKSNPEQARRDTEIVRRLQTIRSLLVEIRQELKGDAEGEVSVFVADAPQAVPETAPEIPDPSEFAEEILPGEIAGDEPPVDDFWSEEQAVEELREDDEEPEWAEEPEPEIFAAGEEVLDGEISEPFTAQPLFVLDEASEPLPEADPEAAQAEEESKPEAVDTQQSLF